MNFNLGSICLSDLNEQAKKGNPAFRRSEANGKIYCNIIAFFNEEADEKNRIGSIAISKDKESSEKTIYVGTLYDKPAVKNEPIENDIPSDEDFDLF